MKQRIFSLIEDFFTNDKRFIVCTGAQQVLIKPKSSEAHLTDEALLVLILRNFLSLSSSSADSFNS